MQSTIPVTLPASLSSKTAFRVQGIPLDAKVEDLALSCPAIGEQTKVDGTICISCKDEETQVAIIKFQPIPLCLSPVVSGKLENFQCLMNYNGTPYELNIDKNFRGLTQLYNTKGGTPITADIVAVTGLAGHALGSWRGKGVLGRIWLRDFLQRDLTNCRTMIYGYDSLLGSMGVHQIEDYCRGFAAELVKTRGKKSMDRPIIFIGHSFGGIVVSQTLVHCHDTPDLPKIHALYHATRAALFFGTPHRGFPVDDILGMIDEDTGVDRIQLVNTLKPGSKVLEEGLKRFRDVANNSGIAVSTFYETMKTQRPVKVGDSYQRTGAYKQTVNREAPVTGVEGEMIIPIDADHTRLVKFDSKTDIAYESVRNILRDFENRLLDTNKSVQFAEDSARVQPANMQFGESINDRSQSGYTQLHVAVGLGNESAAKTLLERGAEVNLQTIGGSTPLAIAALYGNDTLVTLLLEHGADAQLADSEDSTPLHLAVSRGNISTAKLLIRTSYLDIHAKDHDEHTPLHIAAANGHKELVRLLLESGANINARDENEDTALHIAVQEGHMEIVELLLAEPSLLLEAVNLRDETPLHHAADTGHAGIICLLLMKDANVFARDIDGWSPLHSASASGQPVAVRALLVGKPNLNAVDNTGRTPLHIAANSGDQEIVETLINWNANLFATNPGGTVLHYAVLGGNLSMLHMLLEKMNPNVMTLVGHTPLHHAVIYTPEAVPLLIQFGCNVNAVGRDGRTALHWAAANGDIWIMKLLLHSGSAVHVQDVWGATPRYLASIGGHVPAVQLLDGCSGVYPLPLTQMGGLVAMFDGIFM